MTAADKLLQQANRKRARAAALVDEAETLTQRAYEAALASGDYMGNGYLGERADMRGVGLRFARDLLTPTPPSQSWLTRTY